MTRSRQRIPYVAYLPSLLSAGLLAAAAFTASAQTPPPASSAAPATSTAAPGEQRMHPPRDTAKLMAHMQERRAQHLAALKAKLQLSAAQESAWTAFTAAAQPPGPPPEGRDAKAAHAEFGQLTTPQRLDRLQARQSEHAARFAKRADATRSFYAALTPEQKKTFDAEPMSHSGLVGKGGPGGHWGDGGHGRDHGGTDGHRSSLPASPASAYK